MRKDNDEGWVIDKHVMKELVRASGSLFLGGFEQLKPQNARTVGRIFLYVCKQWEFVQVINLEPGPKDRAACYRMLAMPVLSQGTVWAFK